MATPDKILRRRTLEDRVGLSRSTIYDLMKQDLFPKQVKLGKRAVGWRESDIDRWLAERTAGSK